MLANLLAIPICNIAVMPMALLTLVAMPFGLEAVPLRLMGYGIEAMVWCAYKVAALPGAVTRIPAISSVAFGLMVSGGVWVALWRSHLRWLGVVPVLAGLAIAPMRTPPHVLVSRDGSVVGFRGVDGRIAVIGMRSALFDVSRWLEHDGDDRPAATVLKQQPAGLACDWQGCTLVVRGRRIAVGTQPSALLDDCAQSDVVIALYPAPNGQPCASNPAPDGSSQPRQAVLIDRARLAEAGAHLIHLDGDGGPPRVSTVSAWRGHRPWSAPSATGARRSSRRPAPVLWRQPPHQKSVSSPAQPEQAEPDPRPNRPSPPVDPTEDQH